MNTRVAALVATLILPAVLFACSAKETVIGLRQTIHHDDFEYSVQSVDKSGQIGSLRAQGTFYIVAFQVENRAKRVDHHWTNNVAYLVDGSGTQRDNNAEAQKELNLVRAFGYKDQYVTPAGATEVTLLVFDVPPEVNEPYLQVRGSTLMGDVLDGRRFARTKVKLF